MRLFALRDILMMEMGIVSRGNSGELFASTPTINVLRIMLIFEMFLMDSFVSEANESN